MTEDRDVLLAERPIGRVLMDVSLDRDVARAGTYAVAFHRILHEETP